MPRGVPGSGPAAKKATTVKRGPGRPPKAETAQPVAPTTGIGADDLTQVIDGLARATDALTERGSLKRAEVELVVDGRKVVARYGADGWRLDL